MGAVFLSYNYFMLLLMPVFDIGEQVRSLQRTMASLKRINELFLTRSAITDEGTDVLPDRALSVELENVTFGYDEDRKVLSNVSFHLPTGERMGILGRTGSGKTTLTRLLLRLYDATSGAVRLDSTDIRDIKVADLRRHVGMVTQDVQLFQATLRENLTLFDTTVDDAEIIGVLRKLGLREWFHSLPEGLDTRLSAGGGGLSGGEAQLLALTRVFLQRPGLVILDEPSSHLDPATESILRTALEHLFENRTVIIIAHRLATVEQVDQILILENGQVVENGPREALLNDPNSHYRNLLRHGMDEVLG